MNLSTSKKSVDVLECEDREGHFAPRRTDEMAISGTHGGRHWGLLHVSD